MIHHPKKTLIAYLLILATTIYLAIKIPGGLFPQEDQGVLIMGVNLQETSTIQQTTKLLYEIEPLLQQIEGVQNVVSIMGRNMMLGTQDASAFTAYVRLKPWSDRINTSKDIMQQIKAKTKHIKEAQITVVQPPAIRGMGSSNGLQFRLLSLTNDEQELQQISNNIIKELMDSNNYMFVTTSSKFSAPALLLEVDVQRAKQAGVSISELYSTIQSSIGYQNVNQFQKDGHSYWVQMQSLGEYRKDKNALNSLFVKNKDGVLIPISTFATIKDSIAPSKIEHYNGMLSMAINASIMPHYSNSQGISQIQSVVDKYSSVQIKWEGMALQQIANSNKSLYIFLASALMVFLILSAQYGKWILPLAVILSVQFGMFGAFVAILSADMLKDVYFQIGLLVLIALASKNAILVIEFAQEERKNGVALYEATINACRIRYRPMMMTSLAFVFGVLPLVLSSGAGAESRHSIGVGLLGGMLSATFIERYFIPYIYYYIALFEQRFGSKDDDEI